MSQMVLPQTPAPGAQPDTGSKKPPAGNEKSGESRFDSVSRAEQKRLDQKQADRRDDAKATEQARQAPEECNERPAEAADKRTEPARPERNEETVADRKADADTGTKPVAAEESGHNDGTDVVAGAQPDIEPVAELATLTFAGLQALIMPATATTGAAGKSGTTGVAASASGLPGASGQAPGFQGLAGVLAGLPGMKGLVPGKSADAGSQGQGQGQGQSTGFQFSDALTALGSESGRAQDSTSLLASGRVQSLADVSGPQLASARLPADAAGLRGYATSVDVPVGHAEWGDKLVGKLTWLTANKLSVAEIHLTPPDMGPMEVRVQVQQEQASITVHAANPAVRDQLELHSQRLRDMLSEHGLSLEQFDVSDSRQQQAEGQDARGEGSGSGNGRESDLAATTADELAVAAADLDLTWKGEVDIFA